ncbi:MAG: flavodoxin family protein [Candidatus Omnitrophica bacterium]|nr:flavodoxin family protein [Candidatus Omnitrophota bacterium]
MKITAFNGSPRGERGNTHIMVEALFKGAAGRGAEVENVLLVKKNIKHCTGCFACWTLSPGKCIIKDDMAALLDKYMNSDIVVIASPLYSDYVTGIMKDFMDRLLPIVCPRFEKGKDGQTKHVKRYGKYPAIIMMSSCGFPEQQQFELFKLFCERKIRSGSADVIAQIYRSQGELLRETKPKLIPFIEKYKEVLAKAGSEIVEGRTLSPGTMEELEKPIIPEEKYTRFVNISCNKIEE